MWGKGLEPALREALENQLLDYKREQILKTYGHEPQDPMSDVLPSIDMAINACFPGGTPLWFGKLQVDKGLPLCQRARACQRR